MIQSGLQHAAFPLDFIQIKDTVLRPRFQVQGLTAEYGSAVACLMMNFEVISSFGLL